MVRIQLTVAVGMMLVFASTSVAQAPKVDKGKEKRETLDELLRGPDQPKQQGNDKAKGETDPKPKKPEAPRKPRVVWSERSYDRMIVGQVSSNDAGRLELEIRSKVPVPRNDAVRRLAEWQRRQAELQLNLSRARNLNDRRRRYLELVRHSNNRPRTHDLKDVTQNIRFRMAENTIIRRQVPTLQYDDKGQLIPFSKTMLRKLRGPEGYPGYPGALGDLQSGQTVAVFIRLPEEAKKTRRTKPKRPTRKPSKKADKKTNPLDDILGTGGQTKGTLDDILGTGKPGADPGMSPPQREQRFEPEAILIVVSNRN